MIISLTDSLPLIAEHETHTFQLPSPNSIDDEQLTSDDSTH